MEITRRVLIIWFENKGVNFLIQIKIFLFYDNSIDIQFEFVIV